MVRCTLSSYGGALVSTHGNGAGLWLDHVWLGKRVKDGHTRSSKKVAKMGEMVQHFHQTRVPIMASVWALGCMGTNHLHIRDQTTPILLGRPFGILG